MRSFSFLPHILAQGLESNPPLINILKASRELGNISMKFLGSLSVESQLSAGGFLTSSTGAQKVKFKVGFAFAINLPSSVTSLCFIWHLLFVQGSPPSSSAAISLRLTTGLGLSSPSSALSADSWHSGGWSVELGGLGLVTGEFNPLVGFKP